MASRSDVSIPHFHLQSIDIVPSNHGTFHICSTACLAMIAILDRLLLNVVLAYTLQVCLLSSCCRPPIGNLHFILHLHMSHLKHSTVIARVQISRVGDTVLSAGILAIAVVSVISLSITSVPVLIITIIITFWSRCLRN